MSYKSLWVSPYERTSQNRYSPKHDCLRQAGTFQLLFTFSSIDAKFNRSFLERDNGQVGVLRGRSGLDCLKANLLQTGRNLSISCPRTCEAPPREGMMGVRGGLEGARSRRSNQSTTRFRTGVTSICGSPSPLWYLLTKLCQFIISYLQSFLWQSSLSWCCLSW